jgi:hypothetical protein
MRNQKLSFILLALAISLGIAVLSPGLSIAQDSGPAGEPEVIAPGAIPIQGRLTDATGNLLDGTYTVVFSLYETATGGTAICSQTRSITVVNGLFSDYLDNCYNQVTGQKVWLGIKVGTDDEMTPRQVILAVPYALALVPGATIISDIDGVLEVESVGTSGDYDAFLAYADGTGEAVSGMATGGSGVYGESLTGIGILGYSETGTAIQATGTGIIASSAASYVWISGNNAIKYLDSDSTVINASGTGAAVIYRGAVAGTKGIVVPITISGPIYGQNVTITGLDIYWQGDTEFTAISQIRLRRQTAPTNSGYVDIIYDADAYTCEDAVVPDGCTLHLDLTNNNVLTADSGILYMVFTASFAGDADWLRLGGVRLTLTHD